MNTRPKYVVLETIGPLEYRLIGGTLQPSGDGTQLITGMTLRAALETDGADKGEVLLTGLNAKKVDGTWSIDGSPLAPTLHTMGTKRGVNLVLAVNQALNVEGGLPTLKENDNLDKKATP